MSFRKQYKKMLDSLPSETQMKRINRYFRVYNQVITDSLPSESTLKTETLYLCVIDGCIHYSMITPVPNGRKIVHGVLKDVTAPAAGDEEAWNKLKTTIQGKIAEQQHFQIPVKWSRQDSGLPYSILRDPSGKLFLMSNKSHGEVMSGNTSRVKCIVDLETRKLCVVKIIEGYSVFASPQQEYEISKELKQIPEGTAGNVIYSKKTFLIFKHLGVSLESYIRNTKSEPLNLRDRLFIMISLLHKIEEIDELQIDHRDLATKNIMVELDENNHPVEVHIIDFGLSKLNQSFTCNLRVLSSADLCDFITSKERNSLGIITLTSEKDKNTINLAIQRLNEETNQQMILSPSPVTVDNTLTIPEVAAREVPARNIRSIIIDSTDNAATQARKILDILLKIKNEEPDAKKIGITFSATQAQTEQILSEKGDKQGSTVQGPGVSQAAVIIEINKLLSTPGYSDLKDVIELLPIATKKSDTQLSDPSCLVQSIANIGIFSNVPGNRVLYWGNENTKRKPIVDMTVARGKYEAIASKRAEIGYKYVQRSLHELRGGKRFHDFEKREMLRQLIEEEYEKFSGSSPHEKKLHKIFCSYFSVKSIEETLWELAIIASENSDKAARHVLNSADRFLAFTDRELTREMLDEIRLVADIASDYKMHSTMSNQIRVIFNHALDSPVTIKTISSRLHMRACKNKNLNGASRTTLDLLQIRLFLRMKSAETSSPQLQTFFTAVCQDRWTAHVQSSRAEGFFEKRRMRAVTDNAAKIQDIIRSLSPELIDLSLIVKIKISNLTYQIKLSDLKELLESFVGDQSTPPNPLVTNMLIEQVKNIVSNLQKPRDFKAK